MSQEKGFTLGEIARYLGIELKGDESTRVDGIASLKDAKPGQLSFLFSPSFRKYLKTTRASAVVMEDDHSGDCTMPVLIAPDPRLAWAKVSHYFDSRPQPDQSIHPGASVSATANIGKNVTIGANVVIADDVRLGDEVVVGPGCVIGEGCQIDSGTRLSANVTLYHQVTIGKNGIIHSGAVIGADGFGFAFDPEEHRFQKIQQVYGVKIGDDVEIGAGTTIDRGALNDTVLGNGVKLDNQVQVGHNATIGDHTVISGCSAIAGSTSIGSYCLLGGAVGIIDNLYITDHVEITAMTLVSHSIKEPGRYSSGTGLLPSHDWKRSTVGFKKLDNILKRLQRVEKKLQRPDDAKS
ncbi:MAG: UDP-3-O-(3-hydroxymyristoyl)glucosamine N-acyltransferase [Pseudomonadales bacterium]|jgi:UDP-3-O-[3-hydroxymyristoyl] glucosamine N-acyltransferase|nr:UDP-3-O-(3-hydroxymyristoyl)glucosamine N-acyltransferase [Pseudomonadales bacterium]MDP7357744.1 UDP-3-O-(3-hydroxymyristoyl)glucosamine N-acyltransferase [Pseudomonadales bacterium]MDP7596189.1 UDP-3-O-(3-hydroxymyristoyl)glucosamine N-acyltransferase [Pseudomonadales bacterium]HJN50447.1 UDP-3-O-(3-hydroxymyristoyl)glucosamine N-acyltransferase [Pseudomonadales bacterium]|tara:strand:+ start:823 stop:1875 length:1053 start_codon:yes stop_codon:yes gene_type:complete